MKNTSAAWRHPIAMTPMSRRHFATIAAGLGLAVMAGPAALAQTPAPNPEGDPDAVALLRRAGTSLANLSSFTFSLETVKGESTVMSGFSLESVSGAVRRPMDLSAEVNVNTPIGSTIIRAIALDGKLYVQNPITEDQYLEVDAATSVPNMLNPDALIQLAVGFVDGATIDGRETVGGYDCDIVAGTVSAESLTQLAPEGLNLFAGQTIEVTFWINDDALPVLVEFVGPVFSEDSDDVIREIRLDDFNEDVEIEAPENVGTLGSWSDLFIG